MLLYVVRYRQSTLTKTVIDRAMITLTELIAVGSKPDVDYTLLLTAEERTRSHYCFTSVEGVALKLRLPRGIVLKDGDLLGTHLLNEIDRTPEQSVDRVIVQVIAKPEPVLTVTAANPALDLLRAAYHLGNRHVPLEITATYLRLSPDPVLHALLQHLQLNLVEELAPFHPEAGAYQTDAAHSHHA
jgi:urease accessory protein